MGLIPGTRLGPYEIVAALGAGGMGEVYRARDEQLGRDVAIKILPPAFTGDPDRLARFEREARVLASLNHPHIGAIYGLENFEGGRALVLELVPGLTLADRLVRGPLPLNEALSIARQIAEALEAAHEQGIVHRDLKPANIKITSTDVVKVLDFGLAKADVGASEVEGTNSPTMFLAATGAGTLLGTAPYMSPEQARGKLTDKRSDIWAFGCVVYELLTAHVAFKGDTSADAIAAILEGEPDWTALPATTPPSIRRLLQRCMEKNPKRRVHDIADARIEIDDVLSGGASSAAQAQGGVPRTLSLSHAALAWFVAALSLAACLILLAVLWLRTSSTPAAVAHLFLPPPAGTQYVTLPIIGGPMSVAPDGRRLAFAAVGDDGVQRLWVRSLDSPSAAALVGTERASFPFWSPDGRAIGFFVPGKLKRIDASGGPVEDLCDAAVGRGGTWNRDGVIVFSPGPGAGLLRVSDRGGVPTPLAAVRGSAMYPVFLLDGRHFLYNRGSVAQNQLGTYMGSLDADDAQLLIPDSSNVAYARSGYLLYVKKRTLVAQPFDAKGLRATGPAIQIADAVAYMDGPKLGNFSVSETVLAYFGVGRQDRTRLEFVDRAGKPVGTVGDAGVYNNLRLSSDDQRVVFDRPDSQGTAQIWVLDVRSGTPTPLTEGPINEDFPIWWSNTRTVFRSNGGVGGLSQLDVNGIGGIQSVAVESPVGKRLGQVAYDASRDGQFILYGLAQDQIDWSCGHFPPGGPRRFGFLPCPPICATPNSRETDDGWPTCQTSRAAPECTCKAFQGNPPMPARSVRWRSGNSRNGGDGSELFYVAGGNLMVVEIQHSQTCAAGPSRMLFALGAEALAPGGAPHPYGVTADGQRFLISRTTQEAVPTPLTIILNWQSALGARERR